MSTIISSDQLRSLALGGYAKKSYTVATETASLFTVSGGIVLVTSIVGKVTTAMTVANTVKLQANPTTGTTSNLCAATDLGTTDTPAGNLLSITGDVGEDMQSGIGAIGLFGASLVTTVVGGAMKGIFVAAGTIEQVTTGTSPDGVIEWNITYVPIEDGARLIAA